MPSEQGNDSTESSTISKFPFPSILSTSLEVPKPSQTLSCGKETVWVPMIQVGGGEMEVDIWSERTPLLKPPLQRLLRLASAALRCLQPAAKGEARKLQNFLPL